MCRSPRPLRDVPDNLFDVNSPTTFSSTSKTVISDEKVVGYLSSPGEPEIKDGTRFRVESPRMTGLSRSVTDLIKYPVLVGR